ncbi:MAG: Kae1-associated serine/threonine protein kinase [Candidatus Heimdallarchaeota archaeon]|nr:Kae1-associated serine/threonine protein kinase [Candidatus Heimdallarchaeota archaeon]
MAEEDFRGAESKLFKKDWFSFPAVYKKRLQKSYRIPELDYHFRRQRTIFESRLLARAKSCGVRTPIVYEIDLAETTIVMELIPGKILKKLLPQLASASQRRLCKEIGENVGKLHKHGIIHGDLTTSNIIQPKDRGRLVFIDFGLGYFSDRLEDFGIDLYLLERAFRSTHATFFDEVWPEVMVGYKSFAPYSKEIDGKLLEISSRGRYSDRV